MIFYSLCILISQSDPLNPIGQVHVYEATPSLHAPPLLQGFSTQSSISRYWIHYPHLIVISIKMKEIRIWIYFTGASVHRHFLSFIYGGNFDTMKKYLKNILILQSSPINPWAQLHVKEFAPSTHTPSFLQGLDLQSSISAFRIISITTTCFSISRN